MQSPTDLQPKKKKIEMEKMPDMKLKAVTPMERERSDGYHKFSLIFNKSCPICIKFKHI